MTLTLLQPAWAAPAPPVAAIEARSSAVAGELIDLDGAGSRAGEGHALAFSWTLVESPAGSLARIVDADMPKALLHADLPGRYAVQLVVDDGERSSPAFRTEIAVHGASGVASQGLPGDIDGDGVPDDIDNCVKHANLDQRDTDTDGFGNRCDPDLNNDRIVNFVDLALFKPRFFGSNPDADFDGDGFVNFIDLGILKAFFFSAPGPIVIRWVSPVSGDWNDPANWLPAVLPDPAFTARIDAPGDVVVTQSAGTTHVESVISNERLVIAGGSFEATTTIQVNNVLELRPPATLRNSRVVAPEPGGEPTNGVLVPAGGSATMDRVALAANTTLESGATLLVQNGLTLSGATVSMMSDGIVTGLRFQGGSGATSTFGGTGEVVFEGVADTPRAVDNASNGHTLVIGSGIIIRSGTAGGIVGSPFPDRPLVLQGTVLSQTPGHTVTVQGAPLTIEGTVQGVDGGKVTIASPAGSTSTFDASATISSVDGEIELFGARTSTGLIGVTGGVLDIGADLSTPWTNQGTIALVDSATELGGLVTVAALGDFTSDGVLTLDGLLQNTGLVLDIDALPGTSFRLGQNGEIEGGTVGGGSLSVAGAATLDGVTLAANATLESGAMLTVQNGLTLAGATVTLSSNGIVTSLRFQGGSGATSTFGGTGEVVFDGSPVDTPRTVDNVSNNHTLVIGPGISIRSGTAGGIVGNQSPGRPLVLQGTVRSQAAGHTITLRGTPLTIEGALRASAGATITAGTDYSMAANALVHVDIGGTATNQFGRILAPARTGNLNGTLDLALVNGFSPSIGDTFQVMTFGTRAGSFPLVTGTDLGAGRAFQVNYNAADVTLQVVPAL